MKKLNIKTIAVATKITNGCGGKKGTKCGVQIYFLPKDEPVVPINL